MHQTQSPQSPCSANSDPFYFQSCRFSLATYCERRSQCTTIYLLSFSRTKGNHTKLSAQLTLTFFSSQSCHFSPATHCARRSWCTAFALSPFFHTKASHAKLSAQLILTPSFVNCVASHPQHTVQDAPNLPQQTYTL